MDVDIAVILSAIMDSFSYWWIVVPGVIVGIVMGAIPGFAAHNTIIILLPLTLSMEVEPAMVFMMSLYCASHFGGGIPSILMNIPGTGGAAATTLDGYPMTQQGKGTQALVLSFVASTLSGLLTTMVTLLSITFLAKAAFQVQSVEMVVIMLFGIALIAVIAAEDIIKGLIAGVVGLLLGSMGADHIYAAPRGTFGLLQLFDGLPLVPALVGLFAVSEALIMIEQKAIQKEGAPVNRLTSWGEIFSDVAFALKRWWLIVWTGLLGLVIGILPGAGASIAAFVAYQQARMFSKEPEKFGKGHPEGVLAPEAANNGVTTGTIVPLLAIGIPGGSTAAVMMVVLQYHGVPFGPRLFVESPSVAYGVIAAMLAAYVFMAILTIPLTRYMSRVAVVPTVFLAPIIITFTLIGAYVARGMVFDMGLALVFGVIGYIARKTGYNVPAILIGVILGPMLERSFMLVMRLSGNDLGHLFSSTLGNILWGMLVLTLLSPLLRKFGLGRRKSKP